MNNKIIIEKSLQTYKGLQVKKVLQKNVPKSKKTSTCRIMIKNQRMDKN